jgi:hypothetical protein
MAPATTSTTTMIPMMRPVFDESESSVAVTLASVADLLALVVTVVPDFEPPSPLVPPLVPPEAVFPFVVAVVADVVVVEAVVPVVEVLSGAVVVVGSVAVPGSATAGGLSTPGQAPRR